MVRHQSDSGVRRQLVGGSWGIILQEILNIRLSKTAFLAFWRQFDTKQGGQKTGKKVNNSGIFLIINSKHILIETEYHANLQMADPQPKRTKLSLVNSRSTGNIISLFSWFLFARVCFLSSISGFLTLAGGCGELAAAPFPTGLFCELQTAQNTTILHSHKNPQTKTGRHTTRCNHKTDNKGKFVWASRTF